MSKKSQHNNILLAVIGFTAVVILVGVIGFFTLEQKDDTIQGEVEVSEYRVSCKLPGRVVELRVQEGDYVHVGDTLAILEVPEMKSQEQMLQATNAAAEAMKDLTDAGARKEQIQGAYQLVQQAEAAATIAKKTYDRMQNLFNEGVISGQKRDEAYAAYKATEAQVAAARSQYDMAKNGAREQEKRMAANNTQASKSAVDVVKNLLKETVQIAQCEGEVSNVYIQASDSKAKITKNALGSEVDTDISTPSRQIKVKPKPIPSPETITARSASTLTPQQSMTRVSWEI